MVRPWPVEDPDLRILSPDGREWTCTSRTEWVLGLPRVVLEEMEIAGATLAKGDAVCAPVLGATMDPEHYPEPHRVDSGTTKLGVR
jgi:Cytochrome P450